MFLCNIEPQSDFLSLCLYFNKLNAYIIYILSYIIISYIYNIIIIFMYNYYIYTFSRFKILYV